MSNMNIMAGLGVAVREFQLTTGEADYGFYINGKVALLPFHNPKLREILLRPEHQVIDKFTRDQLLMSSFDPEAKQRAETLVTSFRQFIEDNKAEIEAISILYSRPYAAGLRYSQVKELARRLSIKPFHIDESQPQTLLRLWQAFGTVAPDKVDTGSGKKHCKPCFVYPEKRFKWLKRRKGMTRRVSLSTNDLSSNVFSFRSAI